VTRWPRGSLYLTALLWLCCSALASSVAAQSKLTGRDFNVDLVNGPIVGPGRVVGLSGAYTALGYGIENATITPAAYATRTLWESRWFSWDATADLSPGPLRRIDFINDGQGGTKSSDFLFVTLGAGAIMGEVGVGAIVRSQNYRIGDNTDVSLILANYGLCYAFLQGQLLVGVAGRTAVLTLSKDGIGTLGEFSQSGPEAGAILGLADRPYRIGVTARSSLSAENDQSKTSDLGFEAPRSVVLPAEVQVGFAYQFGTRPLNRRWINPHDRERELRNEMLLRRLQRQREQVRREQPNAAPATPLAWAAQSDWLREPQDPEFRRAEGERMAHEEAELQRAIATAERRYDTTIAALSRRYILVSVDFVFVGATDRGIGLEAFLNQEPIVSGRRPSLAFRIGAEGEPIPNQLRVRLGSYLEPARFTGVSPRLHATVGGDLKLFSFDMFGLVNPFELRLTASLDIAESYRSVGISLGLWH
jgi:hypothetical protein